MIFKIISNFLGVNFFVPHRVQYKIAVALMAM